MDQLTSHSGGQLCRIEMIDFRVRQQYQRSKGKKKSDAPPPYCKDTFLLPSAIERLYGQNENLAFSVGQSFYTREREAIIIPMEITVRLQQAGLLKPHS